MKKTAGASVQPECLDSRNQVITEQTEKRKRGRPKGSVNKNKIVRPDRSPDSMTEPGDNSKYLKHEMKLFNLPKPDINNLQSVNDRINLYFSFCENDDIRPSITGLALSFGISRYTLFDYLNNRNKTIQNNDCILSMKKAYNIINSHYENLMNNNRINPVAAIFLLKNNMGYKDVTDYIINTDNNNQPGLQDIVDRAGLLTDE